MYMQNLINKHQRLLASMSLALGALVLCLDLPLAHAQGRHDGPPPGGQGRDGGRDERPAPRKIDFVKELGVDAKTAQALDNVLREHHEKRMALHREGGDMRSKHEALRKSMDEKLAKLLNKQQLAKLHQLMPRPPEHAGGRDGGRDGGQPPQGGRRP